MVSRLQRRFRCIWSRGREQLYSCLYGFLLITPTELDLTDVEYNHPTTCDIETTRKGLLLATSLYYDGSEYEVYSDWGNWLDRVLLLSKKKKNLRTIWAHNGGNFDWQHLEEWIKENKPDINI